MEVSPFATLGRDMEALACALVQRDLPGTISAARRVEWAQVYAKTPDSTEDGAQPAWHPREISLLDHFHMMLVGAGEEGAASTRAFIRQALPLLVTHGYRPLNDGSAAQMINACPWVARQVALVTAKDGSRAPPGGTILHQALMEDSPRLTTFKNVCVPGIDVNARDADGRTVLHLLWTTDDFSAGATQVQARGWERVMSLLLEAGADEMLADNYGNTPAAMMGIALDPGGPNAGGLAEYGQSILEAHQRTLSRMQERILSTAVPCAPVSRIRM